MRVFVFLGIILTINLGLALVVQNRDYNRRLLLPIWGLAILLPLNAGFGQWALWKAPSELVLRGIQSALALNVVVHLFLVELANNLFRTDQRSTSKRTGLGVWKLPIRWVWRLGALALVGVCFTPSALNSKIDQGFRVIFFPLPFVPICQLFMAIYALYLLESTYRFAEKYQRKIGRLCFLSVGILTVHQIFFYGRILLYNSLRPHFLDIASVVYGVTYPVALLGFLRYRLAVEKVSVPRDAIYTSATLFLTGASFLGVALTIFAFRWLKLDFTYFENFLLIFSLCFFFILVLGSGTMRKKIIRLVNEIFYKRKYDYYAQFYRLHKTIVAGTDLTSTVTELVENMKYSVTVDDAFVFFLNWQDENFYLQRNKEQATIPDLVIGCDEKLIAILREKRIPINLLDNSIVSWEAYKELVNSSVVKELRIETIFPILNRDKLLGILGLRGGRVNEFDDEDLELINVFTNSLGDALFKNRVITERIEQKQFESFNHVTSFIVHDIKNQIATLSLIVQNAEKNLGDPAFQKSMLSSVKNCANNLQSLINKLTILPKRQEMVLETQDVNKVIQELVENSGIKSMEHVTLTVNCEPNVRGQVDWRSLYFVLKNLVQNALDAMHNKGDLVITTGNLIRVPEKITAFYNGNQNFFSSYSCYILIEDTGPGMSEEYVREKLFRPFSTTKERGIGIGLYQCKSLLEKMNGKILCRSRRRLGTAFCILLK